MRAFIQGRTGMSVDGKYNIVIKSPMGDQKASLDLKAEGGTLTLPSARSL